MWNVALVVFIVALLALGAWVMGRPSMKSGRRDRSRPGIAYMQRGVKRNARSGQLPSAMRSHSRSDSVRRNQG